MPAHVDDVVIHRSRVDEIDLAVVDLVLEFLEKRRRGCKP